MNKNIRRGYSFTVKLTMWTDGITDEGEEYCFNKVEGFVNFHHDLHERYEQLERQVLRKIEFYEKELQVKVIRHSFLVLTVLDVDFLPLPFPVRKEKYEHKV